MKHKLKVSSDSCSVLLYNLEHLAFSWLKSKEVLALKTRSGKILTTIKVDETIPKEEMVFMLLDKALAVEIQDDLGQKAYYAFINPYTKQIAINPVPKTKAFDGKDLLDVEPSGRWLTLEQGVLKYKDLALKILEPDYTLIKSVLSNQ